MVIIHYQFEAIHPFDDSNGRTGRIINILYLLPIAASRTFCAARKRRGAI